jgi:hypothetical protein
MDFEGARPAGRSDVLDKFADKDFTRLSQMGHPAPPRLCHDWGAPSFPEEATGSAPDRPGAKASSSPRRKIGA